jgi:hypothetical protein
MMNIDKLLKSTHEIQSLTGMAFLGLLSGTPLRASRRFNLTGTTSPLLFLTLTTIDIVIDDLVDGVDRLVDRK